MDEVSQIFIGVDTVGYFEYEDEDKKVKEEHLHGMSSRIFQHENEHMNGYVFIDLVSKLKLERAEKAKDKMIKEIKRRQGGSKIIH